MQFAIKTANAADIKFIESWLKSNHEYETLEMNWNLALEKFDTGDLFVCTDPVLKLAIGYFWGTLATESVVEVAPVYRKQGVGTVIARWMIEDAIRRGEPLLQVECAPETSQHFWRKMGFEIIQREHKTYGLKMLDIVQALPDGPKARVEIDFYPENIILDDSQISGHHWNLLGVEDQLSRTMVLSKVASCFRPDSHYDLKVRVRIDGRDVYNDKCKYAKADDMGIKDHWRGYAISTLQLHTL